MGNADTSDLLRCLEPFDERIVKLAMWLRKFVWDLYPECNELIYDNYNAVAVGWAPTLKRDDIFCSFAVYNNTIMHFGFYWGSRLTDPKGLLEGNGKQYRFIRVTDKKDFPSDYVKELLNEAHINSLAGVKDLASAPKGTTILKSVSPKKKRPAKMPKP